MIKFDISTLYIAAITGKQHGHILRDLRKFLATDEKGFYNLHARFIPQGNVRTQEAWLSYPLVNAFLQHYRDISPEVFALVAKEPEPPLMVWLSKMRYQISRAVA